MKKLVIKSKVRVGLAGGWDAQHNATKPRIRVKANVRAGRRVDFTGGHITEVKS